MKDRGIRLVDLEARLEPVGGGWYRTPEIRLRGWTDDEGTYADRVADPTRPGEFIYGPAVVVLQVAPDGGIQLSINEGR